MTQRPYDFWNQSPDWTVKGHCYGDRGPAMIFKVLPNVKYPVLCPHKHSHTRKRGVPHLDLETQGLRRSSQRFGAPQGERKDHVAAATIVMDLAWYQVCAKCFT